MRRLRPRLPGILGYGLLIFLVLAALVPVGIGALLATHSGTRPQDRRLSVTPYEHGRPYRTVFLETRDGIRIAAWVLPAARPRDCSVVLAHGLFRSRREVVAGAAWLAGQGCHAIVPDLRGHGASGSGRTTLGYRERLDVLAAHDFLVREFGSRRRFLVGVSMGGAASAGAAVLADPPPTGLVLDSTFRNAPAVVDQYARLFFGLPPFPAGDLALLGMGLAGGYTPTDLDVEALAAELGDRGVPILVIAGDRDQRAPPADQEVIFLANSSPRSRFLLIPGAGHGRPCLVEPGRCRAALTEFLQLDIGLPPSAGTPDFQP